MKIEEKKQMSFKGLLVAVSICIGLLAAVLFALSFTPAAFAGDATSFDPTAVAVQAKGASDTPIGAIVPWGSSTVPDGWLECNGQSTGGYPELAALYGSNVPDLRGEFIRGWDHGRGVDGGRSMKSFQNHAMQSHTHSTSITVHGTTNFSVSISIPGKLPPYSTGSGVFGLANAAGHVTYKNYSASGSAALTASGTGTSTPAGSGTENRPRNVALMYIIKAQ